MSGRREEDTDRHDTLTHLASLVGASLSEPHINGTSMRELYIYILLYIYYGTSVTSV